MPALAEFKHNVSSGGRVGSIDAEAARKDLGANTSQSPLQSADECHLPPVDGGLKAWSVIGGAFLALFVQFGLGEFSMELQAFSDPQIHLQAPHTFHLHCITNWGGR